MARAETATAAGERRAQGEAETADAPAVRGRLAAVETMDPNKLGVLLFLSGEVIFFGLLVLAYVYYRGQVLAGGGPNARVLDIGKTTIFSVCLFASSGTIWLSERSLARGSQTGMRAWLFATIALGAVFLVGQTLEYKKLFDEGVTIRTGQFGTTFFTLTGFHGFHVSIGLVMLTILFGLALRGAFRGPHSSALESISYYWHFVDLVWVVVLSVVYLWTLFS